MPPGNNSGNNNRGVAQDPAAVARARARDGQRRQQMEDIARGAAAQQAEDEDSALRQKEIAFSRLSLAERQARMQARNLEKKKAALMPARAETKKLDGAGFWIIFALAVIADVIPFLALLVTVSFAEEAARIGGTIAKTIQIITGIINIALLPTGPVAAAVYVVRHALIKQAEHFLIQKTAEAVFQFVLVLMGMFLFLLDVTVAGIIWFYLISHGVLMRRGVVGGLAGAIALKLLPGTNLLPSLSVSLLWLRKRVNKSAGGSVLGGKTRKSHRP